MSKGKYLKSFIFIEKYIEVEMGNWKTKRSVFLILERRKEQIVQSDTTACIRV